jgi:hypothetical protein
MDLFNTHADDQDLQTPPKKINCRMSNNIKKLHMQHVTPQQKEHSTFSQIPEASTAQSEIMIFIARSSTCSSSSINSASTSCSTIPASTKNVEYCNDFSHCRMQKKKFGVTCGRKVVERCIGASKRY